MFKVLILFFGCMTLSTHASEKLVIAKWVAKADHVRIKTMKAVYTLDIDNVTEIGDLKEQLYNDEDIPVNQQVLHAIWRNRRTLGLTGGRSQALDNNENVKHIMNKYNTNLFELFFTIRKNS